MKNAKKSIGVTAVILAILMIAFGVWYLAIMPASFYDKGLEYQSNSDLENALETFSMINDYKDASKHIFFMEEAILKYSLVGDEVYYGSYRIKNGFGRLKLAPIKWIVIERDKEQAMLVASDCLDDIPYLKSKNLSQTSDLKSWYNKEFLLEAFTEMETENILVNESNNDKVSVYEQFEINNFDSNISTTDMFGRPVIRIKLNLSVEEIEVYENLAKNKIYNEAKGLFDAGEFDAAMTKFGSIRDYNDADIYYKEALIHAVDAIEVDKIKVDEIEEVYLSRLFELKENGYKPAAERLNNILEEQLEKLKKSYNITRDTRLYLDSLELLKDYSYEPIVKEYNQIKQVEAKRDEALTRVQGTWKWQNSSGYYMEIENDKIFIGNQTDRSKDSPTEIWRDAGNFVYNDTADQYEIKNGWYGVDIMICDGSKIYFLAIDGQLSHCYDGYAVRYDF